LQSTMTAMLSEDDDLEEKIISTVNPENFEATTPVAGYVYQPKIVLRLQAKFDPDAGYYQAARPNLDVAITYEPGTDYYPSKSDHRYKEGNREAFRERVKETRSLVYTEIKKAGIFSNPDDEERKKISKIVNLRSNFQTRI
jgi:hypothetical protein